MTDPFAGIETAQVQNTKLPNIDAGRYLLTVDVLKRVQSRKKVDYVIAEFTVKHRLSEAGNEVGSKCKLMVNLSGDYALPTLKNLFGSISGLGEAKVSSQMAHDLTSDKNPMAGRTVKAEAYSITKKNGDPFVKVTFEPYKG